MKKTENATLEDLLTLGGTALNVLLGAGKELHTHFAGKTDALAGKCGLVTREEFDAAFAMIKKARREQIELAKRIESLEAKMTLSTPQKHTKKKQIRTSK